MMNLNRTRHLNYTAAAVLLSNLQITSYLITLKQIVTFQMIQFS